MKDMTAADHLRNNIINKLLAITNKDYLSALYKLVDTSAVEEEKVLLSEEQKIMLELSEKDIKKGKVMSYKQLDKEDLKWLKGL